MGQAKQRGTFEQRKAQAAARWQAQRDAQAAADEARRKAAPQQRARRRLATAAFLGMAAALSR